MSDCTIHHPLRRWYDAYGRKHGCRIPDDIEDAYYHGLYIRYLLRLADFTGKRVLDLGCGTGRVGRCIRGLPKQMFGIDFSRPMLKAAKGSGEILSLMDAARLGFKNEAFDIVAAIGSLEHLEDLLAVLEEAVRVLSSKGRMVFSFHNRSISANLYRRLKTGCGIKRAKSFSPSVFTLNEIAAMVGRLGMQMDGVYATYFFPVELLAVIQNRRPGSWVSRIILQSVMALTDAFNRLPGLRHFGGVYIVSIKKEISSC